MGPGMPHYGCGGCSVRDGVFDRLGGDEVEYRPSDERRSKMGRKVVVQEKLPAHEEEREVMESPRDYEKSGIVQEALTDIIWNGIHSPSPCKGIRSENADENRKRQCAQPPASDVTNQVDLLFFCHSPSKN